VKNGQSSKKRPVYVNGKYCEGMAAGARHASEVLKREVFLWEIQRILDGVKHISGLEVIRADVPIPRRMPKKRRAYPADGRRKISAARKGKLSNYQGKRQSDLAKFTMSETKVGEKNSRSKLTEGQVWEIKDALAKGEKILTLALRYKVRESLISMIKNGKRWKHITEDEEDWE
jgi:hypothetical protein